MRKVVNGHAGHVRGDAGDEVTNSISHRQELITEELLLVER